MGSLRLPMRYAGTLGGPSFPEPTGAAVLAASHHLASDIDMTRIYLSAALFEQRPEFIITINLQRLPRRGRARLNRYREATKIAASVGQLCGLHRQEKGAVLPSDLPGETGKKCRPWCSGRRRNRAPIVGPLPDARAIGR